MQTVAQNERAFGATSPMVWGLAVSQLVGWGTLYFAFSVFVGPMEAELGWSRAALNGALTTGLMVAGLASIPVGWWIDRHGGHLIMSVASVLGAVLLAVWSLVETLPAFYALWIAIGLVHACTLGDGAFAVLTANVKDYRRAMIYVTFVTGFCTTVCIPLTSIAIELLGWRQALLVLAALQLAAPGLLSIWLLRGTRGSVHTAQQVEGDDEGVSPLAGALRRRAFWGMALCFGSAAFMFSGLTFHFVPLLSERGVSLELIVTTMALTGPAQVAGRFLMFVFGRDTPMRVIGRATVLFLPVAMLSLFVVPAHGLPGLALFALIYGAGNGMLTIVRGAGIAEFLGTRGYGSIAGALSTCVMVPRTAAPLVFALVWETTGHYDIMLWVLVGVTILGAAGFWVAASDRGAAPAGQAA